MKTTTSSKGNIVAIITMMFLFAMISFVTNLAAPVGVIWKNTFAGGENANTIGMLGNAMNFLAYLFMGIPSGKMLAKIGYKNTAMTGVATGIVGLVLQFLSGTCSSAELGFSIYLLGAFVCGFSVCMLNTVVNPMINLLGGGGNGLGFLLDRAGDRFDAPMLYATLIILAVLIITYGVITNRTVFGRQVYAIGGNLAAATLSGVKVRAVNFWIFVNMGFLAGVAKWGVTKIMTKRNGLG